MIRVDLKATRSPRYTILICMMKLVAKIVHYSKFMTILVDTFEPHQKFHKDLTVNEEPPLQASMKADVVCLNHCGINVTILDLLRIRHGCICRRQ